MAFMNGWDFVFLHKQTDGSLMTSASVLPNWELASVDELFKDKGLNIEKTYFIAKEGVYYYSSMNNTWYKSNK